LSFKEIRERHENEFGIRPSRPTVKTRLSPEFAEQRKNYWKKRNENIKESIKSNAPEIIEMIERGEKIEDIAKCFAVPPHKVKLITKAVENRDILERPLRQWLPEFFGLSYFFGSHNKTREVFNVPTRERPSFIDPIKNYLEENRGCELQSLIYEKFGNLSPYMTDIIHHTKKIGRMKIRGTRECIIYLPDYEEKARKEANDYLENKMNEFLKEVGRGITCKEMLDKYSGLVKNYFGMSVKKVKEEAIKIFTGETRNYVKKNYEGVEYAIDMDRVAENFGLKGEVLNGVQRELRKWKEIQINSGVAAI